MAKNKNREQKTQAHAGSAGQAFHSPAPAGQARTPVVVNDNQFSPWLPVYILAPVFAVWAYLVLRNYFMQNPVALQNLSVYLSAARFPQGSASSFWGVIFDDIVSAAVVFMMLLAAFGAGDLIREKLFGDAVIRNSSPAQRGGDEDTPAVISLGIGIAFTIMIVLFIGLAGLLYAPVLYLLFISLAALGAFRWRVRAKEKIPVQREKKPAHRFFAPLYILIICAAAAGALFGALPPETFYDTLLYHLGVPLQWIQEHRIYNIHHIMQSFYPLNSHVLYAATLLLKDEKSAKLLNWAFGLLNVWLIISFGKKYFSRGSGIFAAAVFLATPMVILVSSRACIELPLAFFETLCLFGFFRWYETRLNKWFYLSAIFLGMALGSKYTSAGCMISVFILMAGVWLVEKKSFAGFIKKGTIYALIVFAVMSPWFIKNYFDVGNPIHPFKLSAAKGVAQVAKGRTVDYIDQSSKMTSPLHFVTVPWRVAMTGEFQESYSGAAFLFLVPLLFLFGKNSKYAKLLAIYAIPYYLIWVVMGRVYFRFLIPFLPALALLLGYYISESRIPGWLRSGILLVAAAFLGSNVYFALTSQSVCQDPVGVLLGKQDKLSYLSTQRPTYPCPYYQVIDWANKNLPQNAGILSLGETRGYYSKRKIIACSAGDVNPVIVWCRESKSAEDLSAKMKANGVTHILINVPEAKRLTGYDMFSFESGELKIFIEFWNKYVREIYKGIADVTFTNHPGLGYGRFGSTVPEFWNSYVRDPKNYVYLYEILPDGERTGHIIPDNFLLLKELYTGERYEKLANEIAAPR